MPGSDFNELGSEFLALRFGHRAARVKTAARRRVNWAGNIAFQDRPFAQPGSFGVWHRNGRKQGFSVGMLGIFVKFVFGPDFNDFSQVHHGYPVADMANHAQIMGDEQIGQPKFILKFFQQVNDLGLDGNI